METYLHFSGDVDPSISSLGSIGDIDVVIEKIANCEEINGLTLIDLYIYFNELAARDLMKRCSLLRFYVDVINDGKSISISLRRLYLKEKESSLSVLPLYLLPSSLGFYIGKGGFELLLDKDRYFWVEELRV